jgi:hypothetical protein
MRTIRQHWLRRIDRFPARTLSFAAIIVSAQAVEAQEAHFEVLTIPPADVGTCLPAQVTVSPTERSRPGNRLVIRHPAPFMSRDISTFVDSAGRHTGLSDRSSVIVNTMRNQGASIVASVGRNDVVRGFRIETIVTVPDSLVRARDVAAIQKIMDSATGTSSRRELNAAEQDRVRSMIEFMRRRCP